MERDGNQAKPALTLAIGTLIVGLASFVVWLLRIRPRALQGRPALQMPGQQPQPYPAPGGVTQTPPSIDLTAPTTAQPAPGPGAPDGRTLEQAPTAAMTLPPGPPPSAASMGSGLVAPVSQPAASLVPGATTRWAAPTRYMAGAGLVLAFLGLVYYSRQTLTMLIFAALIAILTRPAIGFLQRRLRFPAGPAVVTTYLAIAALLIVLPLLIVPSIIGAINSLLSIDWPAIIQKLTEGLNQAAAQASTMPLVGGGVANAIQPLADFLQNLLTGAPEQAVPSVTIESFLSGLGNTVGLLAGVVGPLVSGILSLVFLLLISLQMSIAGDQVRGWIMNVVPPRFEKEVNTLLDRISLVWVSFLRGQFALMVVMGLLVWLMNWALGTPQALLLGLLAGLLEIIPSLGPTLAAVPAALLALLLGSSHFPGLEPVIFMLVVIVGYVLLNLLENQVLVPRILGDAVDLPPLIVLVGATIGGVQAGIAGVFLATPVIATGRELFEYVYAKIREVPEVEPPEEENPSLRDRLRGLAGRIRLPFRRKAGQT